MAAIILLYWYTVSRIVLPTFIFEPTWRDFVTRNPVKSNNWLFHIAEPFRNLADELSTIAFQTQISHADIFKITLTLLFITPYWSCRMFLKLVPLPLWWTKKRWIIQGNYYYKIKCLKHRRQLVIFNRNVCEKLKHPCFVLCRNQRASFFVIPRSSWNGNDLQIDLMQLC